MKSYHLSKIPADVYQIVLEQQNEEKKRRGMNQFSFEAAIYKIVREFKKCKDAGYQTQVGK